MPVDTKDKRFSMMAFGGGVHLFVVPDPDGSFDQGNRQHWLGLYSGILASEPVEGEGPGAWVPYKPLIHRWRRDS